MKADHHRRVKEIFLEASELPHLERDAFLRRVCASDAVLRAENAVKKEQLKMLIRLRNLLTEEQFAHLESQHAASR